MKKNAFAIAAATVALTMAGSANAQSNVTIYGLIDVGVEYLNHANANGDSLIREIGANMAGSRWGVRGSEDLGGGLKAIWQIEQATVIDAGGGLFASRDSFLGLTGGFGTIRLGLMDTVWKRIGDPMSILGISSGNIQSSSNILATGRGEEPGERLPSDG